LQYYVLKLKKTYSLIFLALLSGYFQCSAVSYIVSKRHAIASPATLT